MRFGTDESVLFIEQFRCVLIEGVSISYYSACYSHKCIHLTYSYALNGHGLTTPKPSLVVELISDAFIIAIISFVINISQAKLLAKKNSYTVHPDQVRAITLGILCMLISLIQEY